MRNRALGLATIGTASAKDGNSEGAVAIGAIYRTITSDRQVPNYGLHRVIGVLLCGINGTRDLVVQLKGKASATVARTMLQLVGDEARLWARTCTRASLDNHKANSKGKVRMECAAAIHFMGNRGWEKIIDACLGKPSLRQHQVGDNLWESVCKTWWRILQPRVYTLGIPHGPPGPTWAPPTMSSSGANLCGSIFRLTTYIFSQRSGESCQRLPGLPWREVTGG